MKNSIFKPVFTVVMPMYNVSKYVSTAIESVLNQTYPHFELLCIDDGSTDNTVNIVNDFFDPRIRLIRQANRGLAGARNTGINNASGLYVAFLDSDDFWHKDKLFRHIEHFRADKNLGLSYSASQFVNENGESMGIGQHPKLRKITPEDIFCRNPVGNGSAPVIRYSVLAAVARVTITDSGRRTEYFDETLRQSEDIEFWLRLALSTDCKFEGVGDTLTYYRVNSAGLSANLEKQFNAWLYCVEKNYALNPEFFDRWTPLAKAYQYRYLARRAIQARNRTGAIQLIFKALKTDMRIIKQEPGRTLVTLACALLNLMPSRVYELIENSAMQKLAHKNRVGAL